LTRKIEGIKLKDKVGLAFSGGADSTFAAILLKKMGYEVVAFNFPIGRRVSEDLYITTKKLGMKLEIIDIRSIFDKVIKENFYDSYLNGLTPNPCVRCNRYIKFGLVYNIIKHKFKIEKIATGHYAKIYKDENTNYFIQKAIDIQKDQSYFLWQIHRSILKDIIFPLGDYRKEEVKKILTEEGFENIANKEESFDICFVNEDSYKNYISKFGVNESDLEGYFVDENGQIIGKHNGIFRYTIGQRKGLNIAFGKRMYVRKIDSKKKEVVIGRRPFIKELKANCVNLFLPENRFDGNIEYQAKVRYKSKEEKAKVKILKENNKIKFNVDFSKQVEASSCGQSVVIYDKDLIVAGGIIESYQLI